jgi:hypothetical protein
MSVLQLPSIIASIDVVAQPGQSVPRTNFLIVLSRNHRAAIKGGVAGPIDSLKERSSNTSAFDNVHGANYRTSMVVQYIQTATL